MGITGGSFGVGGDVVSWEVVSGESGEVSRGSAEVFRFLTSVVGTAAGDVEKFRDFTGCKNLSELVGQLCVGFGGNISVGTGQGVSAWCGVEQEGVGSSDASCVGVTDVKSGVGVTGGGGVLKRGKNFERNKANREAKARTKLARKVAGDVRTRVPEWRRKGDVCKDEAQKTLEEKWVIKNRLDTLKLKEQLRVQELRAGNPRLFAPKVWTEDDEKMAYETKLAKLKSDKAKYVADEAYWKKRAEKGAVEKAIDLEIEIMDGQLSGKYDVFADKRTIGWAKTVKTNSSASSGANKTVWSGSGASKVSNTRSSVEHSIVSIEKHEELLKRLAVTESELIKVTEEARKYKTLGARAAAALKKQQKDKDEQEQWENSLYY